MDIIERQDHDLHVLVIEDDIVSRKLLEMMLTKSTLDIAQITGGDSLAFAFAQMDAQDISVILLDLNLPDSAGLVTVSKILLKDPFVPIIVVTGESEGDLGLESVSMGAQEYLVKGNFDSLTLDRSIRYAVERKRIQQQTEIAFKELENAHHELQNAQSQIIQNEKLASIGQLAAGVAHEMNTPVGFVASNFETLEKYMKKIMGLLKLYDQMIEAANEESLHSVLDSIIEVKNYREEMKYDFIMEDIEDLFEESHEGLQRVTEIVQNLRDFSRIDQATDVGEYNLNEGIKNTLTVAKNEVKYDLELVTEFGDVPEIFCNSGQVNQVFLNILVNGAQAIKSMDKEAPGVIKIATYVEAEYVVCEIQDNGPGIQPEIVSKIFDPFFTTKPVGKGTGLGLSVSHDIIVNKHKGELLVDSQVGVGTKFTIKLPVHCQVSEEGSKQVLKEMPQYANCFDEV